MKKLKLLLAFVAALLVAAVAYADIIAPGAAYITQSGTRNDASQVCINAGGTAQQTVTLPACGSNQYHYITSISSQVSTTAALAAATAFTTTTTNLNSIQLLTALTTTAGVNSNLTIQPATPIKDVAANTATTVVSNAAVSNATFNVTACYYCAP